MELQQSPVFAEPTSLVEAKQMRRERERQVERIEAQIQHFESLWEQDGAPQPPSGPVDTKTKFIEWRFRARQAIGHKNEEIDRIDEWSEAESRRLRGAHISADGTLFEQVTALARSLADDRGPERLSRTEQTVLRQAEAFVQLRTPCH